jgi:isoleucyl-tRNA synthetase
VLTDLASAGERAFAVRQTLQVNARVAGPRLGREVQTAIRAAKAGDWTIDESGTVVAGGVTLQEGEYAVQAVVADADPADQRAVAMLPGSGFVILDTAVTPELAAEGLARDVVRAVQQARRDAGLDVSDRIRLILGGSPAVQEAVRAHRDLVASETLAVDLQIGADLTGAESVVQIGDRQQVGLSLSAV